jgi:hypothetical protein
MPEIVIPSEPPPPVPNARDYYKEAGKFLENHKTATSILAGIDPVTEKAFTPTTEQLRKGGLECLPALDKVKQGFRYDYAGSRQDALQGNEGIRRSVRDVSVLLLAKARISATDHDWKGSMDAVIDGFRVSVDVLNEPDSVIVFSSFICQLRLLLDVSQWIGHLDGIEARTLLHQLENVEARQKPLSDIVREDKWTHLLELKQIVAADDWADRMAELGTGTAYGLSGELLQKAHLYVVGKRRLVQNFIEYMDQLIEFDKRKYGVNTPPPVPADPIRDGLRDLSVRYRYWYIIAREDLLKIALAIQAYHCDHGAYPSDLNDLCPEYMKELPEDPFAHGGTYHFRKMDRGFIVCSVGPDGRDDLRAVGSLPVKQAFSEDDKGDIVLQVGR